MPRTPKALIVACESYPKGEDIAHTLTGTLDSARECYRWLTQSKGLKPVDIYICCDSELIAGHPADHTYSAASAGVRDAITDLVETHRNNVTEFYFFFSGHGLGYEQSPQQRGLDLLLTTDYRRRKISGAASINVGQLQAQMEIWLGGDDHYYFLDACRTILKAGEIVPAGLGLGLDPATAGDPTTYAIFSTKFGEPAPVNPKFPQALLTGLKGEGRAKTQVKKEWWVQFDRLQQHIERHVDTPTDSMKIGAHGGLIAKLAGPIETALTVRVDGAKPDTDLEFKVESNGIEQSFPFKGPTFKRPFLPSDAGYGFEVLINGTPLQRVSPVDDDAFDLYEPIELRYQLPAAGGPPTRMPLPAAPSSPPLPQATIGLRGPNSPAVDISVVNSKGKTVAEGVRGALDLSIPPGEYRVEVNEDGRRIHEETISLRRGDRAETDYFANTSRVRRSIASHVPNLADGRVVDFSETLGPLAMQHTPLWLSMLGASRIIRDPQKYSKIGRFPLANFEDLREDESAVYVLAGLEEANRAQLSVSPSAKPKWKPIEPVAGFDGVFHQRVKLAHGSQLVSIALPDRPPATYASYALPNRVTLIVINEDQTGKLDARQMLLPLYTLVRFLPAEVTRRAEDEGLRLVRYLVLQQDRFANRESLAPAGSRERKDLQEMLYGKWLDPLLALTAIYEMARRGETRKDDMAKAVGNLERYFGELPDVAAVRRILNPRVRQAPSGVPLLRESLLRLPKILESLPLPSGLLDYGSMWTSWTGAVKPPNWN